MAQRFVWSPHKQQSPGFESQLVFSVWRFVAFLQVLLFPSTSSVGSTTKALFQCTFRHVSCFKTTNVNLSFNKAQLNL